MFQVKKKLVRFGLGVATMVALALPTSSFAVTWNFGCTSGCSGTDGSDGNQRTFGSGSDVLTVRAFATSNIDGTGNFQAAFLGWYSGGLGVTAPGGLSLLPFLGGDGDGIFFNQHTVDNIGKKDLIVFKFPDSTYLPISVLLTAFGDTDIDAFVGGNGKSFSDFTSLSYSNLTSNGFTACTAGNSGGSSDRTANLSPCNLSGQYLIIGADIGGFDDLFKIANLTGDDVPPRITVNGSVPEPSTMFLLGFGLIGLRLFLSYRFKMNRLPAKTP